MITEVRDCDFLIVVTSSTFLKRKDMLKEQKSLPRSSKPAVQQKDIMLFIGKPMGVQHINGQMYCVHLYG